MADGYVLIAALWWVSLRTRQALQSRRGIRP